MWNFGKSLVVLVGLFLLHLYFYQSEYVKKNDYKLYDLTTTLLAKTQTQEKASYSVVVDIDEKSLQAFGQWPWARVIDAELINMIYLMSPSAIGVNILFPEKDRLSPLTMQAFYQKYFNVKIDLTALDSEFQDNDKLLSDAIKRSKTTLSIYLHNGLQSSQHCQKIVYKANCFKKTQTSFATEELLCNHQSIQTGVENFGFINAWSDSDGIFRRVPLFMKYKEAVFPSFALATLLSFYETLTFTDGEDTLLVNFSMNRPKIVSALDVLSSKNLEEAIKGKVVILGSSVVGLNSRYQIFNKEYVSNSMIHAMLVDNILNKQFLVQPKRYQQVNILLSFLFLAMIMFFLSKKNYFDVFVSFMLLLGVSMLVLIWSYMKGTYISIGYFWVPFISVFIVLMLYHVGIIYKEQQAQEKFLIRQSKLASMGEMISLIAHQWRQPLSSINGTVLNMDIDYRKNKLGEERFDNYLNDIEETTAYLSKTINDFSDFFSSNKKMEYFNLSTVITQAKHLSAISLSGEIEIINRHVEEVSLNGYRSELLQSLLILLNNAIYICQKNLEQIGEGKIFIDVKVVANNILLVVEDNGGGVKKKEMKKIFNPYFTTKEQHNGTGLGLYILKLIIEDSMNGKVFLKNGKEGAIFTIQIPMNKA